MRIAVLGTGMVAHTLGGAWKKAGHDVVLGARDVADDPDFQVLTLQEAIVTGELVVNAITGSAALEPSPDSTPRDGRKDVAGRDQCPD